MIKLTSLNGDEVVINAELIETVKATPDTVITLTSNKTILVKNEVDEVIKKVISYRKNIHSHLREVEE